VEKNKIGLLSASFIGISSIIGSGWLFAAYATAEVSGPAAILAWIIGGIIVLFLALCFSEIASLYPRRGLSAVVATLSHHKYFGFPFAIANWLGIVAVIALEADATVEYLINIFPHLKPFLFVNHSLTLYGNAFSLLLVIMYCLVNFWGVRIMAKTNNILAVIKTIIPVLTVVVILTVAFHPGNFTAVNHSFVPYGYGSIFTAIITTGIIISFNGFQSVVSFASEVKNPHRNIPLSLIISIVFCVCIYLLLQISFIAAMPSKYLGQGWDKIIMNAPMVQLATALGLGYLSTIIYCGAFVAPFGTAVTFTGTATRMFTAMSKAEQMPKYFSKVDEKVGLSRKSLILNAVMASFFLVAFKSWSDLAIVLSLFHVFSYLPVPLALIVFRKNVKPKKYKFKLKGGRFIAISLFVIFNFLIMYGSSRVYMELITIMALFQSIFVLSSVRSKQDLFSAIVESVPLFFYFLTLGLMAKLSPANGGELQGVHFIVVGIMYSLLAFYFLLKLEKHDAAIAETAVEPYVDGH
jgi:amino acid transporter